MTTSNEQLDTHLRQLVVARYAMSPSVPDDSKYLSVSDYVLDQGEFFRSEALADHELRILEDAIAAANQRDDWGFEPRQCFANAARLVLFDESGELRYCEGFALGAVMPVAHAWAAINGKVVDLTWTLKEGEGPVGFRKNTPSMIGLGVWFQRPARIKGWNSSGTTFEDEFSKQKPTCP